MGQKGIELRFNSNLNYARMLEVVQGRAHIFPQVQKALTPFRPQYPYARHIN